MAQRINARCSRPTGSLLRSSTARWLPSGACPRDSFAGHQMHTPWDPLHRAYFNGEALWTYLATPIAFAMDGFRVEEIEERSSVTPYGAADQRTLFTPHRIAIE